MLKNRLTRIFVAFPVPEEIARDFSNYSAKHASSLAVRWTRKENLHITIFFIGEVHDENVSLCLESLQEIIDGFQSFELEFERITYRGKAHAPGMIWAQFAKSPEFNLISERIHKAVAEYMTIVPQHLDPIPHITLARLKKGSDLSSVKADEFLFPKKILVAKIELWKTVHEAQGVIYKKVDT